MTLELACAADRGHLPHAAAMAHSVLEHAGALGVRVHYLHEPQLPRGDLDAFARMVERGGGTFAPHAVAPERVADLAKVSFAPPTLWFRAFLPELLPEVDRVLYLDTDTLAVDDLAPLWATPLDGALVAAVTNVFAPWDAGYPASLGLEPGAYFNSGVLLMDLGRMRRDDVVPALLEYGRTAPPERIAWGDQDALNVVVGDRRVALAPRWNCMWSVRWFDASLDVFGPEAVATARARPAIRHFEGPASNKPWHFLCEPEARALYARHRAATPWPRLRLEGATPRNRLRRALAQAGRAAKRGDR